MSAEPVAGRSAHVTDVILRRATPPVAALAAFLAACREIAPALLGLSDRAPAEFVRGYVHAILGLSYQENGFIRRGLGGTIMLLLDGRGGNEAAVAFFLFGAAWLLLPLTILLYRLAALPGRAYLWLAIVLVLSPQLFLGWATDVGRGDMLVAGFVAWAAVAAVARAYALAAVPILLGTLAHDTALFYGAALLLGIWFFEWRSGTATLRQGATALLLLLAGLGLIALAQQRFGDGITDAVATLRAHNPDHWEWAAYFSLGGARSIWASACMSFSRPHAWTLPASCYLVLLLYLPVLMLRGRLPVLLFIVSAVLPLTALLILAVDYGRWLMLAVMNAWLLAAVLRLRGVDEGGATPRAGVIAALLLAILFVMRPTTVHFANGFVFDVYARIGGTTEGRPKSIEDCDPTWRSAIGVEPVAL